MILFAVSCENCCHTSSVLNLFPLVNTVPMKGMHDLEEAIGETLRQELCEGTCSNCEHTLKCKVTIVLKAPQNLVLHLPRFMPDETGGYSKCFNELVINSSICYASHTYKLAGLILHHGPSKSSGHYTAVCREGNAWYHFDDSKVIAIIRNSIVCNCCK